MPNKQIRKSNSPITTFSMLGGRASGVELHLKSLRENTARTTEKICLLPGRHRKKTFEVIAEHENDFTFIDRESFGFESKYPDANYDKLLHRYCSTDNFLFLHDDAIIHRNLDTKLEELLKQFDFVGAIDNAVKPGQYNHYSRIIWDGQPMSEIRIGTWLFSGNYETYATHGLSVGLGGQLYPIFSNLKYRTTKLWVKGLKARADGGFNFNIKARVLGLKIKIFEAEQLGYATHFARVTTGFLNRKLDVHIDSDDEVDIWKERFRDFGHHNMPAQAHKDLNFLTGLCALYKKYGIKDDLINEDAIEKLRKIYNGVAKEPI